MKAGIAFVALLAVVGTALAQSHATPSPALLVLSKRDRTLAIVDPAALQVVARMPSGPDPHEVEASTDGKLAYISNYGFGAYNTITVVDLAAQKTLRAIDLGVLHGPHGLTYVRGKLYFTAEANKVVGSYDPALDKVIGSWAPGRIAPTWWRSSLVISLRSLAWSFQRAPQRGGSFRRKKLVSVSESASVPSA